MREGAIAYALMMQRPPGMTNATVDTAVGAALRAHRRFHAEDPHPNCVFCKFGEKDPS